MGRPLLMTGRLLMMVAVLAVAACAPHVEWVKTSATPTQEAADEQQCNDIAYNEASLEMMSSHPLYPPGTDPQSVPRGRSMTGHGPKASYSPEGARDYERDSFCRTQRGLGRTAWRGKTGHD